MAKKFKDLIQFYPNAKKGKPEESEGTLDQQGAMPAVVVREQKNDQMEITHKSGRKETAKVHMTGSDYHIVKNKHGQQFTVNKKGHVLHGHGNVNEGYNDNRTGFAKKQREDDEYHTPDPTTRTHKIGFHVSKEGGEKHHRTVTISNSTKSKEEATAAAKAHLEKQGYKIHEEIELDEGVDPSEVASNPRMYSAETAKKAYYHKSASASDKESLAKHLDRHHGNKNWRKPVKEEAKQIDEVGDTAKGQKLLQRVNKRAVDRLTSKRADTDPAYAKKAQQTHLAADERLKESMTDSWKSVQAMDKGSLTGGKEEAKKHLAYLNAVHAHHKKYGNDTKKVRDKIESINRSKIAEEAANLAETYAPVAPTIDKKYIKGTPEWKANKEKSKPRVGHPTNKVKEETEMETQLDERNKENATKRKMMDASRGARYKVSGNPVPDRDPQHKTAQAHNKAIGRALRNEEAEEETLQFTQEELQLIEQFIELAERMNLSKATMGDVIKDFKKSDAPQFAGKSDEKRRQMAIAAKLQADRDAKKEETETPSFSGFVEGLKGNQHKIDKNKNGKIDAHDFKLLRKEETEQVDENAFDWKSKKSEPSSGRYEIKRENGRTIVTRKYNPETGHSTGTDDEPNAPKRGRGRPAGSKNRGSAK